MKTSRPPASPKKSPSAARKKAAAKSPRPSRALSKPAKKSNKDASDQWTLRLYVAGQTPRSITAFANLKRLCEEYLPGRHVIEVIDLLKEPHLAQGDQIVALPTLVRKLPEPIKRIVGDLSNVDKVMVGLEFRTLP